MGDTTSRVEQVKWEFKMLIAMGIFVIVIVIIFFAVEYSFTIDERILQAHDIHRPYLIGHGD